MNSCGTRGGASFDSIRLNTTAFPSARASSPSLGAGHEGNHRNLESLPHLTFGWPSGLEIEEAALTGESLPVGKSTQPVRGDDVPLGADNRVHTIKAVMVATLG
jgi:hypothetical protein